MSRGTHTSPAGRVLADRAMRRLQQEPTALDAASGARSRRTPGRGDLAPWIVRATETTGTPPGGLGKHQLDALRTIADAKEKHDTEVKAA
jgi:hypothetical protein